MSAVGHVLYGWFGLNQTLFLFINGMHGALWDRFMAGVSAVADGANFPWYMAAALLLACAAPRLVPLPNAVVFGIGYPVVTLVVAALKAAAAMPRPALALGDGMVTLLDRHAMGGSFPSNHAAFAALFAAALSAGAPRLMRWLLASFVVLVALSRIVLGAHFPVDTVAGALVGTGVALVIRALLMYWGGGGQSRGREAH